MRVMVTGAGGFVGSAVLHKLISLDIPVCGVVRTATSGCSTEVTVKGDMDATTDWADTLKDIDVVVHCAARAHIMDDKAKNPLAAFRKNNVEATLNLCRQAANAGVKRFIFISSVKVNGEATTSNQKFSADDLPAPLDPYGISKWEAEQGLRMLASETGIEVVIIRPPLVYGSRVKGNFQSLLKLAKTGIPLPLGDISNRRSMIFIENLVDFIVLTLKHPAAANETFLVADEDDLSTAQLLQELRQFMKVPVRIFSVPQICLYCLGSVTRTTAIVERLCGSLCLDVTKTKNMLGWKPTFTAREGLQQTVTSWLLQRKIIVN
ncbi:MAG: SDR family oxidoreductase [Pseudomonadota bacterium]